MLNPNAFGDPHLVTLDGRSYDLQSVGEFHLLEVPDAGFDVQARFVPAGGSVSVVDAVALNVGGERVELRRDGTVLVEGDADALPGNGVLTLADGSQLYRSGSQRLIALKNPAPWCGFSPGPSGSARSRCPVARSARQPRR